LHPLETSPGRFQRRRSMRFWIPRLALALGAAALLPGVTHGQASKPAKVKITTPANGATVSGPVKVTLQATGVEIVPATDERPGTGHHHLFVDHDVTPVDDTIPRGVTGILHLGRGQTEFVLDSLKRGPHQVIAAVADSKHRPLKPPVFGVVKIAWIVLAAVYLYDISVHTGQFEIMKESVAGITPDRRLQVLLVAFCFGAFIEGAAGFGAPVAIAGAFMIGLGFKPFHAAA